MDNKVISCPQKMADMLAEQHNSVFSIPKEKSPSEGIFQCGSHVQNGRYISDIEFSVKDIEEAISDISTTAAAGPDRFPAILLKQCKSQLAKPLFIIWRTSMDSGVIPDIMKTANIIPVHKGGSRGLAKNYRPIALTSHPGLDIRLVDAVARGASRFENLLAPQKTYWPPKKLTGPFPKTKLVR